MALECKVYVGNLPEDATESELEKAFCYFGPLRKVWVARNPPGFAFVEYQVPDDADEAVKAMNGKSVCGMQVKVQKSSGKIRPKPWLEKRQALLEASGTTAGEQPVYGYSNEEAKRVLNINDGASPRRSSSKRSRSRSYSGGRVSEKCHRCHCHLYKRRRRKSKKSSSSRKKLRYHDSHSRSRSRSRSNSSHKYHHGYYSRSRSSSGNRSISYSSRGRRSERARNSSHSRRFSRFSQRSSSRGSSSDRSHSRYRSVKRERHSKSRKRRSYSRNRSRSRSMETSRSRERK